MKNFSLHIAFATLLSLLALASCSRNDNIATTDGEEGKVYVTLTLSINGEEAGSRAAWDPKQDTDEEGVGWENEINNLQILIYDENDTYAGTVEGLFGSGDQYIGTLSGTNWQSGTYKFVVLANFTATNTDPALADLASITYIQDATYIPMYGVRKGTFTFEAGENTNIGSIDLLRAMAKVEVNFSEDFPTDEYTIGGITVSPYNTQGYCVPKGYASVDNTGDLDREEAGTAYSFNPLPPPSTTPLTFKKEDGKYYLYLPEYENTETNAATIQVTVNGETYPLEFKNYENGTPTGAPYDIVRNHIYRYTITGVNDGELTFEYRVLLWDKVESQIGWNPEIQDGGNAPVSAWRLVKFDENDDSENAKRYIDSDYKDAREGDEEAVFCYVLYPRYDSEKDAKHEGLENKPSYAAFNFHLSEPKGAVWKAWLSNTTDFSLATGDYTVTDVIKKENGDKEPGDTHTRHCAITGIARDEDYQIQVTANHPWTDLNYQNTSWGQGVEENGREVYTDLHISISTDGGETWHDLAINREDKATQIKNGEEVPYLEHTYWKNQRRFAGGNDYYIRIWQLKPVQNKGFDDLIKDLPETHSIKDWWKGDDSN